MSQAVAELSGSDKETQVSEGDVLLLLNSKNAMDLINVSFFQVKLLCLWFRNGALILRQAVGSPRRICQIVTFICQTGV